MRKKINHIGLMFEKIFFHMKQIIYIKCTYTKIVPIAI